MHVEYKSCQPALAVAYRSRVLLAHIVSKQSILPMQVEWISYLKADVPREIRLSLQAKQIFRCNASCVSKNYSMLAMQLQMGCFDVSWDWFA